MIRKFNNLPNEVKKSVADQMKLLSWVLGVVNGFFMHLFGDIGGVIFIIIWWVIFQCIAHYILLNLNNKEVDL